jgi:hypothetical protein
VLPTRSETVTLPAGQKELVLDLPADLQRANVLVEARGGPITRRQTYLASSLAVQTVESYGQLVVTQVLTGKPLPKTYVKVYARLPGAPCASTRTATPTCGGASTTRRSPSREPAGPSGIRSSSSARRRGGYSRGRPAW